MKPLFTNSQTLRVVATLRPPALCGCYQILIRLRPTLPFPKTSTVAHFQAPIFPISPQNTTAVRLSSPPPTD
jgi:hypothetical protein